MKIATRALAGLLAVAVTVTAESASGPVALHTQGGPGDQPAASAPREKQERRTKWWKDDAIKKELVLSIAQADKIDRIWESTMPSMGAAHNEMEGLKAELSRLIRENTADEKVVALQIDRVEALRSQINKARSLMLYRMHRVLNASQHQTLTKIMDARRKARERREARQQEPTEAVE